jgi:hypothetical protein
LAYFTIEGYNSYSGCDITVTATLPSMNGSATGPGKYYTLGSLQTLSISTHQDKRPVRSLGVINAKDYVMGPRTIAGSMVFAVFNKHFATEIMNDLGATGSSVILPDEIPALDITINFANEYGRMSRMAIYGVKIINEGQVMSINDLYTENTYQFVALGLEPLNVNVSTGNEQLPGETKKAKSPFISNAGNGDVVLIDQNDQKETLLADKDYNNNSGVNLALLVLNNNLNIDIAMNDYKIINYYSNIELSVKVEQPGENDNMGLAVFNLLPKQNMGAIYIYNVLNKSEEPYILYVQDKVNYIMSLPIGSYTAQYNNDYGETSNTVEFTIENVMYSSSAGYETCYPVIEKVTDKSITVSNGDYSHRFVHCYKSGGKLMTLPIGKNPVTIESLEPDTEYYIYTSIDSTSNIRSEIISVKTYKHENEELLILKDYVINNSNIVTSIDVNVDLNFEHVDIREYNTLIDFALTLPESDKKQELLIYANRLTKQLTLSHNKSNDVHITNNLQSTPFDSVIELDGFSKANVFNCNNKKISLNTTIRPSEECFYAKPNQHYCVYGILENKNKSIKQDFVVCKQGSQKALNKYCEVNKYRDLNYDNYIDKYKTYSYETIEACTIKDSCYSDINVIEQPYVYQSNNKVFADVNYLTLKPNEKYYLVCEELYSALDYVPHRKISFTSDTKRIDLDSYFLGLIKQNKYLFWIENKDYIKISKSFLFVYDTDDIHTEVQNINKQNLYAKLSLIKKELIANYGNKLMIADLFDYVISQNPEEKDLNKLLNIELINKFTNSIYISNVLDPLFELNKIIHISNDIKNLPNIILNRKDRIIKFENLKDLYICAINYNDLEAKKIIDYDDTIYYGTEGYTFVYLISSNMLYKSGFLLIDNVSGRYKYTEDLTDYIIDVEVK